MIGRTLGTELIATLLWRACCRIVVAEGTGGEAEELVAYS